MSSTTYLTSGRFGAMASRLSRGVSAIEKRLQENHGTVRKFVHGWQRNGISNARGDEGTRYLSPSASSPEVLTGEPGRNVGQTESDHSATVSDRSTVSLRPFLQCPSLFAQVG